MARSMTSVARCGWPIGMRTRTNIPGDSSRGSGRPDLSPGGDGGTGLSNLPRKVMLPVVELTWGLT